MEINPIQNPEKKISILTITIAVLFGMFTVSSIFALTIGFLNTYGIYLGTIICGLLTFAGFKYGKKKGTIRVITWSILSTLILSIILISTLLVLATRFLEEISL